MPSLETIERDYPHVMAKLRGAWGRAREFDRLIDELLVPERPGRKGFSPKAALELTRLREYYAAYSVGKRQRVAPQWPDRGLR